jgi:uncharacterized protein
MNPRYRTYKQYLKEHFSAKVYKIPLDAGFTCPNIDGTVAVGGCTYCDNKSFSPNSRGPARSVSEQMIDGMAFYRNRYGAEKFIAYFQAFTNTHGPVDRMGPLYDEALSFPGVVGLSIGTRPDCVPDEVLDLLSGMGGRTHLWVEYGLQTKHDETLRRLNRGHTCAQFLDAVQRTHLRKIPVCAHVILGLPGETHEMMMGTAETISRTGVQALKIHHLYISKNTALEKEHRERPIPVFGIEAYVSMVCDFLERMPPEMIIERLMGEMNEQFVVAPRWGLTKSEILDRIDEEFSRRGTQQGSLFAKIYS